MKRRLNVGWPLIVSRVGAVVLFTLVTGVVRAKPVLDPLKELDGQGFAVGALFSVDGKDLDAINPDLPLNPASVSKIMTSAGATAILGPDYRVATTVSIGTSKHGKELFIKGGGDPLLTDKDLISLAKCVAKMAPGPISRVVFDTGPFNADDVPPAFAQKSTDASYRAGVAGLQVNLNAIAVVVKPTVMNKPPKVSVKPATDYVIIENKASTAGLGKQWAKKMRKDPLRIETSRASDGRMVVSVKGIVSSKRSSGVLRRVEDPALNAAGVFTSALASAGVKIGRKSPSPGRTPKNAKVLCSHESAPLSAWLVPVLHDSLNPVAETVLRHIGVKGATGPVGFDRGVAELNGYLEKTVNLPKQAFSFKNGSGLYDANKISARGIVRTLTAIEGTPAGKVVHGKLPTSARDGTMKYRFKKTSLEGRVHAKTGTLDDAVALAGTIDLPDGRHAVFAIVVNSGTCKAPCRAFKLKEVRSAIDRTLLRFGQKFAKVAN